MLVGCAYLASIDALALRHSLKLVFYQTLKCVFKCNFLKSVYVKAAFHALFTSEYCFGIRFVTLALC